MGADADFQPHLSGEALAEAVAASAAEVLIVRSTQVPAEAMGGGSLRLIIRAGAGTNTIDVEAASERGILVSNCPGRNAIAVAELAFGLMLAADRSIAQGQIDLREGRWNKKAHSGGRGLFGSTLGLIGLGQIGQEMVPRAKAFGMNVVAHSRFLNPEVAAALQIGRAETPQAVAQEADFLSIHVPMAAETRGMVDAAFIAEMKPGAVLVNTSRAEVVDEAALIEACRAGRIKAGLDVMDGEPAFAEGAFQTPLAGVPGIVLSHHIGASTQQAQLAIADEVVRIVHAFRATGQAPNTVNVRRREVAVALLVVRHLDRVGVLAEVFEILRDEGINVQEAENIILGSAQAAIAQISLDKPASEDALERLKRHPFVLDAVQSPLREAGQ
jgi:D-3-phosphoglycerate dehydrogenase